MNRGLSIAFFGSSLVSAYWNGAATYYRGIIKALSDLGHRITFYEPDAFERQSHRDMADPAWARVVVYSPEKDEVDRLLRQARQADVIVKASGVGVLDEYLEEKVPEIKTASNLVLFWDVDAPATLNRVINNPLDPFKALITEYDLVLTYGGGPPVIKAYSALGAKRCIPIYNALDPDTHYPVSPEDRFTGDISFLGNRLPDREDRVEQFFIDAAALVPDKSFLLGGSGWQDKKMPSNINYVGHVYTHDHNAFHGTPKAILNICRQSMADYGYSPATRVFEAAGAEACIISDKWKGIETFLTPGEEVLTADNGAQVADIISNLSPEKAKKIGKAARKKVLTHHTYAHRAKQTEKILFEHL